MTRLIVAICFYLLILGGFAGLTALAVSHAPRSQPVASPFDSVRDGDILGTNW